MPSDFLALESWKRASDPSECPNALRILQGSRTCDGELYLRISCVGRSNVVVRWLLSKMEEEK